MIQGPWDGEEAITLFADLNAGATGSMMGGGYPDGIRPILDATRTIQFTAYRSLR
jgi:2-keto-3-deoxy-L-arabinonate dehydratase